eukprot:gene1465-15895_t
MMDFRIINVILLEKMKAISFMEVEDFTDSLFGMGMLKTCLKQIWLDYFKTMQKGIQVESNSLFLCPLPTISDDCNKESTKDLTYEEDGEQKFFPGTEILDLAELSQKDVPLLADFGKLANRFASLADFAIIYVEEAHPVDGWRFKNAEFSIYQHTSLSKRKEAARILAEKYPDIPVFVDLMDNAVSKAFGAMPERLFILMNNEVVYQGGMGPFFYNLEEVKMWLEDYNDNVNNNNDNNNDNNNNDPTFKDLNAF